MTKEETIRDEEIVWIEAQIVDLELRLYYHKKVLKKLKQNKDESFDNGNPYWNGKRE